MPECWACCWHSRRVRAQRHFQGCSCPCRCIPRACASGERFAKNAGAETLAALRVRRAVRDTPSQTALDVSQRHRNVRGAFAVRGAVLRRLLDAGHVAIVDDVMTTGSTLQELRKVLLAAGVRRVELWAVARAS